MTIKAELDAMKGPEVTEYVRNLIRDLSRKERALLRSISEGVLADPPIMTRGSFMYLLELLDETGDLT